VSAAKDTAGLMEAVKAGPHHDAERQRSQPTHWAACIALTAGIRLKVP